MTTLRAHNDPVYRAMVKRLRLVHVQCWRPDCTNRATSPDHDPPLSAHTHIRGTTCCVLRPSCIDHQRRQGAAIVNQRRASGYDW